MLGTEISRRIAVAMDPHRTEPTLLSPKVREKTGIDSHIPEPEPEPEHNPNLTLT